MEVLYDGCVSEFDFETAYASTVKRLCDAFVRDPKHDGFFNNLGAIHASRHKIILTKRRRPRRPLAFCTANKYGHAFHIEYVQAFKPRRGHGETILIAAHRVLRSFDSHASIRIKGPLLTTKFWNEMRIRHPSWKFVE